LQPLFDSETETNEEIIHKYNDKFKTIQNNLLIIQKSVSLKLSKSFTFVALIDEISKQIWVQIQELSQIHNFF
jgi:hypothetical protein